MNKGFTLVEMLIALVVSGLLLSAVYSAFQAQQQSYLVQEQVAEAQQTVRAVLETMAAELRMAGFSGTASGATIHDAQIDAISFSFDQDNDGSLNYFAYDHYDSAAVGDQVIGRSTSDSSVLTLTETPGSSNHFEVLPSALQAGHIPFALKIDGLEFFYQLEDGSSTTSPADPSAIRSIQISILARAAFPDRNYSNNEVYTAASGATWGPFNDGFRRRFQTMTVKCRNMGL